MAINRLFPSAPFQPGDRIRIIQKGPFAGMEGRVIEGNGDTYRVVMLIFNCEVHVDLYPGDMVLVED